MPAVGQKSKVLLKVYIPTAEGKDIGIAELSFISNNKYSYEKIIADMKRRLLVGKYHNSYRTAIFYKNSASRNKEILEKINNQKSDYFFNKETAKIKMLVYIKNRMNKNALRDISYTYYSPDEINHKDNAQIINFMKDVYLTGQFKNQFETAVFYQNAITDDNGNIIRTPMGEQLWKTFGIK